MEVLNDVFMIGALVAGGVHQLLTYNSHGRWRCLLGGCASSSAAMTGWLPAWPLNS